MNILLRTLRHLKVPHTTAYVNMMYEEHPYRDTLYGLSRMLETFHVENQGIRVSDKSALLSLPLPCIAQVYDEFSLVFSVSEDRVEYEWKESRLCVDVETFKKRWTGVILILGATEKSREPDYAAHLKAECIQYGKYMVICVALLLLLYNRISASCSSYSLFQFIPLVVSALGLAVCYLLLGQQVHAESTGTCKVTYKGSEYDGNCFKNKTGCHCGAVIVGVD